MKNKEIRNIVKEIQTNYREGYNLKTNDKIFNHILKQIEKHIGKLAKLRDGEDIPGRFKREVADMYLLALGLVELEAVDDDTILKSGEYYLNKVKENSRKVKKIKNDTK